MAKKKKALIIPMTTAAVLCLIVFASIFQTFSTSDINIGAFSVPLEWTPYDLVDGCRYVYLDVGSNIGVQVRKLFEPELYSKASILQHFNHNFGSPDYRKSKDSGVCAFGFEANPSHAKRLKKLEACYQRMGWRVHFFAPGAAGIVDGTITFFSDNETMYEEWSASIYDHGKKGFGTEVPVYDLAKFAKKLHARRMPPVLDAVGKPAHANYTFMKLDVEASEYTILPHMLTEQVLCTQFISEIAIEWHSRYAPADSRQKFLAFEKNFGIFHEMTHGHCERTKHFKMDDESYLHDGQLFPELCHDLI